MYSTDHGLGSFAVESYVAYETEASEAVFAPERRRGALLGLENNCSPQDEASLQHEYESIPLLETPP